MIMMKNLDLLAWLWLNQVVLTNRNLEEKKILIELFGTLKHMFLLGKMENRVKSEEFLLCSIVVAFGMVVRKNRFPFL